MAGLNDFSSGEMLAVPGLGSAVGGSSNKEIMADARRALAGNWGLAVLGYVLFGLLIFSFMALVVTAALFVAAKTSADAGEFQTRTLLINPVVSLIQFLVSGALIVGFRAFSLGIVREGDARLERLFAGFRRFGTSLGLYFFYSLFISLWSLLLVIPGIIAAFRYAMAFFILADDENCGPLEALSRSKEMMNGNKWKYFCLCWRFFGWALLCSFLPIGWLWLIPYMQTSLAAFYEDVS